MQIEVDIVNNYHQSEDFGLKTQFGCIFLI